MSSDGNGRAGGGAKGNYEVGYGRPPKHTQFKSGRSGNPNGRPKGARSFATDAKEMLATPVPVKENGRTKHMTTQKAGLMRLREKALNGDQRALDRLIELGRNYNDEDMGVGAELPLPLGGRDVLERWYERRQRKGNEVPGLNGPATDEAEGPGTPLDNMSDSLPAASRMDSDADPSEDFDDEDWLK